MRESYDGVVVEEISWLPKGSTRESCALRRIT